MRSLSGSEVINHGRRQLLGTAAMAIVAAGAASRRRSVGYPTCIRSHLDRAPSSVKPKASGSST